MSTVMNIVEWDKWFSSLKEKIMKWLDEESKVINDIRCCKRCGQKLIGVKVYCLLHWEASPYYGDMGGGRSIGRFRIPRCPNQECSNHRPIFWEDSHLKFNGNILIGPGVINPTSLF